MVGGMGGAEVGFYLALSDFKTSFPAANISNYNSGRDTG